MSDLRQLHCLLFLFSVLCMGCASSAQHERAREVLMTPENPLLAQHLAEAEGVLLIRFMRYEPTWALKILPDGSGSINRGTRPSLNAVPEGTYNFPAVLRMLEPTLRRERVDDPLAPDQYSVMLYRGTDPVRYYPSDIRPVLELFEISRPWMSGDDREAWERRPPATVANQFHPVFRDTGNQDEYAPPHWLDADLNGEPERDWPVAYRREATMRLGAGFKWSGGG